MRARTNAAKAIFFVNHLENVLKLHILENSPNSEDTQQILDNTEIHFLAMDSSTNYTYSRGT